MTGRDAEKALERAGLTCNKNAIPFGPEKPFVTSGIRLGTPAGTTRGLGEAEFAQVGALILRVLRAPPRNAPAGDPTIEANVLAKVRAWCRVSPIYPD